MNNSETYHITVVLLSNIQNTKSELDVIIKSFKVSTNIKYDTIISYMLNEQNIEDKYIIYILDRKLYSYEIVQSNDYIYPEHIDEERKQFLLEEPYDSSYPVIDLYIKKL